MLGGEQSKECLEEAPQGRVVPFLACDCWKLESGWVVVVGGRTEVCVRVTWPAIVGRRVGGGGGWTEGCVCKRVLVRWRRAHGVSRR